MLQYVKVQFEEIRDVLINGKPNGKTNEILRVDAGTHEFSLDGDQNFTPASVTKQVASTTVIKPLQIDFTLAQ